MSDADITAALESVKAAVEANPELKALIDACT